MKRRTRALAGSLLAASLLAGVLSAPAIAQETEQPPPEGGSGNDNVVVAINTQDGRELFRVGLRITRATGELIDASNGAAAVASCVGCETIAAAYQVVLIFSNPQVVITENIAFAFNLECDFCVTVAYASQFVLTTGGVVHFTPEGNRLLAELRQELQQLRNAELTLEELVATLRSLADRLEQIVRTELVPAGPPGETAPEPTPDGTSSPSPSPTPEPSPSP